MLQNARTRDARSERKRTKSECTSQQQRNVVDKCDQDDDNNEVVRSRVEDAYTRTKNAVGPVDCGVRERSMNRARHDYIENLKATAARTQSK